MNPEKLMSMSARVLFLASLLFMTTAVAERAVNLFGYTILFDTAYAPGRLLEFAVIFLIFVIALLLRQVREELKLANQRH